MGIFRRLKIFSLVLLSLSVFLFSCASVNIGKMTFHSPHLTTWDGDSICAFEKSHLIVTATNEQGRLFSTAPSAFSPPALKLPREKFSATSSIGSVNSNLVFTLYKTNFRYILLGAADFSVRFDDRRDLSFEQTLPFDLDCYRVLNYRGADGKTGKSSTQPTDKRHAESGGDGQPGKDIDVYLCGLTLNNEEFMFLKIQDAKNTSRNDYYLFPLGTTNIVIDVQGGNGGNGGNGRDGAAGVIKSPDGKPGGNGGNAGCGARAGAVKFFYSPASAGWLGSFTFITNSGLNGTPGYAGKGGLRFKTTDRRYPSGKMGANGYSGLMCNHTTRDGPAPFFMQFEPSSGLIDEINAGLPLR